jgi:isopentenyl-diphosphate delta-isomerase
MGIRCELSPRGSFIYQAALGNGLVEHELDHLFVGRFDGDPKPDLVEAEEWSWTPWSRVVTDCAERPERFTVWLPIALRALGGPPRL